MRHRWPRSHGAPWRRTVRAVNTVTTNKPTSSPCWPRATQSPLLSIPDKSRCWIDSGSTTSIPLRSLICLSLFPARSLTAARAVQGKPRRYAASPARAFWCISTAHGKVFYRAMTAGFSSIQNWCAPWKSSAAQPQRSMVQVRWAAWSPCAQSRRMICLKGTHRPPFASARAIRA